MIPFLLLSQLSLQLKQMSHILLSRYNDKNTFYTIGVWKLLIEYTTVEVLVVRYMLIHLHSRHGCAWKQQTTKNWRSAGILAVWNEVKLVCYRQRLSIDLNIPFGSGCCSWVSGLVVKIERLPLNHQTLASSLAINSFRVPKAAPIESRKSNGQINRIRSINRPISSSLTLWIIHDRQ